MKVFAVGSEMFTTIFKSIGCEAYTVIPPSTVMEAMGKILSANGDVGLILIQSDLVRDVRGELTKIRLKNHLPIIYMVDPPFQPRETREGYRKELVNMVTEAQAV
ncbi:MAG: hypothetical protein JRN37_03520 [Nitrososphaerota archaeon]|jgi:vacuolar-type H+-ATPase subunit F/Vma7|nr:hypothetical protein [Nitrososphaerota archaeon]